MITLMLASGEEIEVIVDASDVQVGAELRLRPNGIGVHAYPDRGA